ncbi:MAG TPA: SCP2 sterol-binding domain-containing protein [Phycisphaerales bacterium]|nr:SCP2 sterol-binding domain-containing protein [Phycisphaerales bacterium]
MARLDEHPTVRAHRSIEPTPPAPLTLEELRRICLDAGADDVGVVEIARPEIADQREEILRFFPATQSLISIVCRMNREPILSAARNVANLEFHTTSDHINHAARLIVAKLALRGIRAINPPSGFPMDMASFPGKLWVVSHKPVAVAAGLGQMGIHRNVIHPKFGNFILLGTILTDAHVDAGSSPIDYNPCLECKLCVAACPVGAISENGFNFSACYTHNYREFMGGFTDWVETIAGSRNPQDYRDKVTDGESASMWQSLAFGPNYKAAYCLSVCPAGEDVIGGFLKDRSRFIQETLKPLQQKRETIYVQRGSDAESHAAQRFPHKTIKHVGNVLRPTSIKGFLSGLVHVFQPGQAKDLDAVYHFQFTGLEPAMCTITIRHQHIELQDGHVGTPSIRVRADSASWIKFVRRERGLLRMLLSRKLILKGDPRLLAAFGKCFPG